ncbi:hypothetical protein D9M71_629700 [compost metagenome]
MLDQMVSPPDSGPSSQRNTAPRGGAFLKVTSACHRFSRLIFSTMFCLLGSRLRYSISNLSASGWLGATGWASNSANCAAKFCCSIGVIS